MRSWVRRFVCGGAMVVLVAACSSQMEPARRSLGEIQAMLSAVSGDAAEYVPDRLSAVQTQLRQLERAFDGQDYAAVVSGAPAVLRAAQGLSGEAAAAKAERRRALGTEWAGLAASLPGRIEALQRRFQARATRRGGGPESRFDLDAARADLGAAESLWSKAQAAFATGNLDEAVTTARRVGERVDSVEHRP